MIFKGFLVYSYRNLRLRETNPESVACVPIRPNQSVTVSFTTTIFMVCKAPFYPNRRNYTSNREHDGNSRKSWFLVLRAGLFTKKTDAEHQAVVSDSPVLTFRTCAEAQAHWAADCREFHPHGRDNDDGEGSEEENEPSRPSSPPPFSTPAPNAVRASVKREVRASAKREPPVKDDVEEAKTPLFREDSEVSPLSRPRKRPMHLVSPRTPGPDASSSRVSPPSTAGSISSVSSLSASVGSSASRTAPPLRSLPRYPPSSRPAAPHLHAGGSASAGTQSRRHAELPVLFNNSTRTLYKDALETDGLSLGICSAMAVREMGKEDSIQVLEVEDLEEFLSAPPRAAA
ncbi:hypothetical protein B0H13DRAFT_1923244 [Mycena leptocephala]|nr:hypothetical protein B0H13DRAFT_1923244 [Mycena leptocephala]